MHNSYEMVYNLCLLPALNNWSTAHWFSCSSRGAHCWCYPVFCRLQWNACLNLRWYFSPFFTKSILILNNNKSVCQRSKTMTSLLWMSTHRSQIATIASCTSKTYKLEITYKLEKHINLKITDVNDQMPCRQVSWSQAAPGSSSSSKLSAVYRTISYTESYRNLQKNYQTVQQSYRTRKFELECSMSAPFQSRVHRNRTYPTLKTFLHFYNYRSFEGVDALEGC